MSMSDKGFTARSFVRLHGAGSEAVPLSDLTPEEWAYFIRAVRYRNVVTTIAEYEREGMEVVLEDESLRIPPEPVGRFREVK